MASLVLLEVCQPVCFAQLMIEGDPSGLAGSHSSMAFDSVVAIVSLLDNLGHFVCNLKTGASFFNRQFIWTIGYHLANLSDSWLKGNGTGASLPPMNIVTYT